MPEGSSNEVLAVVQASLGRRVLGIGCLAVLGGLVIYVALTQSPAPLWQVLMVALGAAALWMADRMRQATNSAIELTETELRDREGTVIVRLEDIEAVDRGVFAFKPSNGFLLKTRTTQSRVWRPGLWWRTGRRIGVGGMTPGSQTKFMSEIIATILAQRAMDSDAQSPE